MAGGAAGNHSCGHSYGGGVEDHEPTREGQLPTRNLSRAHSLHLVSQSSPGQLHFNLEAGSILQRRQSFASKESWRRTLQLAFQSVGVVYGDIGTSPLYVFAGTFHDGIKHGDDLLGTLSLIIYTILLIPFVKYVFVVLWANDNGEGGTFALYSLISRHAKVSLVPNQQAEDANVSNYRLEPASKRFTRAEWVKEKLEKSTKAKVALFLLTILATSMVIGDGVLTPCISVISAIDGVKQKVPSLSDRNISYISAAILVALFGVQRFGTDKVGYSFAPIVFIWFLLIGGTGIYNLFKYEPTVLRAFNPMFIVDYFKRNGKQGWISLGGIVLCITGTEAMFADLGHFNVRAIQIGFTGVLLPAVSLAYIGQASYLAKFPDDVAEAFFKSIPDPLYWPTFTAAIATATVASQAMISGAFSIVAQSQKLGCFPRVRIQHTSTKYEGQVYIPEVNYGLMLACVIVTVSFKTTLKIANAYGMAVVAVMTITTCMVALIMLVVWKSRIWWIVLFLLVFGSAELLYLSSVLYKFVEGGYLPLVFSAVMMAIMAVWHYVHVKRYWYELNNKVASNYIKEFAASHEVRRIPGIGLFYSEMVQGIPPIFPHFIEKIRSIHQVLVFVSIKHLPVSRVEAEERFVFRRVIPRESRVFRCVARYGYRDALEEASEFESTLVEHLQGFVRSEQLGQENIGESQSGVGGGGAEGTVEEEVRLIEREKEKGVVYLLGEARVVAAGDSSFFKRVIVNYVYDFIRRNSRQGEKSLSIPRNKMLKVGVTYEI